MSPRLIAHILPVALLGASNVFMTFAWYGHLKHRAAPLVVVVLVSWGIALLEYVFAVPANRIGAEVYSVAQLKTIQEVITLTVFAAFSALYLKQSLSWTALAGFGFIAIGAGLVFRG